MRIGIYNEPSGNVGGSEYVVSVLAHALSRRHHVEVIHHNRGLTRGPARGLVRPRPGQRPLTLCSAGRTAPILHLRQVSETCGAGISPRSDGTRT